MCFFFLFFSRFLTNRPSIFTTAACFSFYQYYYFDYYNYFFPQTIQCRQNTRSTTPDVDYIIARATYETDVRTNEICALVPIALCQRSGIN